MLWAKKYGNLSGGGGGNTLYHGEYHDFPHAENLALFFFFFVLLHLLKKKKKIRGNIIYNFFYQLVVNKGELLTEKRERSTKITSALKGTRYFRVPFPISVNISPLLTTC